MKYSIKRFLLTYITLMILVVYALISAVAYWVSNEELNELYDANLQQVANTIAAQRLAMPNNSGMSKPQHVETAKKIHGEEEFHVRVIAQNGRILYESHPEAQIPTANALGLTTQRYQSTSWRLFSVKVNNETIQVAQSLRLRKNTIKETALSLMTSQLLCVPVLMLLIFYAIKMALIPLSQLSNQILSRNSTELNPFLLDKLPIEIKPLVESLNQFMGKVSSMVAMLNRFTADAAHELRTPITALKLQVTVLEQAETTSEKVSALQYLKAGIQRSEHLVAQLLTLARLAPENNQKQLMQFDLGELVKESIEQLLPFAQKKNIDLGFSHEQMHQIYASQHEIKILINNVLDNAIRYSHTHGKIDVELIKQADKIILKINDNGPGISDQDKDHVFDRFYRGEHVDTAGSGLGLSIVKEIADRHGLIIALLNRNPGLSFNVIFTSEKIKYFALNE